VGMAEDRKYRTVPLRWDEVYYTNCPLVSASNVDQRAESRRRPQDDISTRRRHFVLSARFPALGSTPPIRI